METEIATYKKPELVHVKHEKRGRNWLHQYRCFCGDIFVSSKSKVELGRTKSCGCYKSKLISEMNTTHGLKKSNRKLYNSCIEKVNPSYTSQICNAYGFKSVDNRKSQSKFVCCQCGNEDNADENSVSLSSVKRIKYGKTYI